MKNDDKAAYVTRESVLNLLTDDEVAKVSTAETAPHLADGDEYLDLEHLGLGVLRAGGTVTPMGHVLPRKAVHDNTWNKIVAHLAGPTRT